MTEQLGFAPKLQVPLLSDPRTLGKQTRRELRLGGRGLKENTMAGYSTKLRVAPFIVRPVCLGDDRQGGEFLQFTYDVDVWSAGVQRSRNSQCGK